VGGDWQRPEESHTEEIVTGGDGSRFVGAVGARQSQLKCIRRDEGIAAYAVLTSNNQDRLNQ
jgi:hypothetical protein